MSNKRLVFSLATSVLLVAPLIGQGVFERDAGFVFGVPVAMDGTGLSQGAGNLLRDADHGTVAMNSNRDIAVAFHSVRDSSDLDGANFSWNGEMKQVELAYFEYKNNSGVETWEHLDTVILGSVDYSPLSSSYPVDLVRCERPDVIAVEDKFFVVWTSGSCQ